MLFTSMEFIFMFLPIVLLVNFLLPRKCRNVWLLIASLMFYAWGEPRFVIIMMISIVLNYFMAIFISMTRNTLQKCVLSVALIANLSLLFIFKYLNFVTLWAHKLLPFTTGIFPETSLALPIGISFFTFQAISYLIDVYRGIKVQKNMINVGLYIALFPQLIAGPIVRYTTIMEQIQERKVTLEKFSNGMLRFLIGFNKKMLLANQLANVADSAFKQSGRSVAMAWLGALAYSLQIYYDFSGYSDMAIGLGKMLGFDFLENFNYPYISKTVTEFWRRWHISLGSWFRDYLYFPLGGSRVASKVRLVFNLMIVWTATGIWHGANWGFIVWGIMYGVLISVEKLTGIPEKVDKNKVMAIGYRIFTLLVVMFGWVIFRAEDIVKGLQYLGSMFGSAGRDFTDAVALFRMGEYKVIFAVALLFSMPVIPRLKEKVQSSKGEAYMQFAVGIVQMILFAVSISYLVINAHNPFIYFNF